MNNYLDVHYDENGHRIQVTEWKVNGLEATRVLITDQNEASRLEMWFEEQGAEKHLVLWPDGHRRFQEYRLMNNK